MQLIIRLGITLVIITLFFTANHLETGIISNFFRIIATVGLFQIIVSNVLWKTYNARMQEMINQGVIVDDYDTRLFINAAVKGGFIAFGILIVLYLPNYIAVGWVWIISYLAAFIVVQRSVKGYLHQRKTSMHLRSEAQMMVPADYTRATTE
ncbi:MULTISPECIES: hypothetical protein [unclassified Paenibacillus]|uniref:hypothetical protein n=1 Tax=Paenibacillus TaxID=44249 RepID=UPI00089670D6|nr:MULTISPECIES: hypothetical protein [unclassified Paenibacillus]SDX74048.1 hypothetical protein SAMN05518848_11338 [Paenibacillus sp. PDC88]SFS89597.1 hypothetical protein SAMN04488601_106158 [Paenibacillus sp. 453mf]